MEHDAREMNSTKELYIQYGRFCERHGISNYDDMNSYEDYLYYGANEWENEIEDKEKRYYIEIVMKHQLINFLEKIINGTYQVIILDENHVITVNDDLEYYLYELLKDAKYIVIQGDMLNVIHNGRENTKLIGYKTISDEEVFARKYLETCEDTLIVKDFLSQIDMEDSNFKDVNDFYDKCKDIINIRTVPKDSENYSMNYDVIIVMYNDGIEEIWQRG